jgi:hypothetical protein
MNWLKYLSEFIRFLIIEAVVDEATCSLTWATSSQQRSKNLGT